MNQSELKANTSNWFRVKENTCEQVMIGFSFTSDWLRSGTNFSNQSQQVVKQN